MNKLETDIVIVAGGTTGLAAAVSAAETGTRVILFEKGATTGGAANMGMGSFAVESRIQKAKQIDLTRELGVKIHLQTPVKKILKQDDRITGVIAEDRSGNDIQADAKAVVVATGGFGDNPKMIKKYTEYEYGDSYVFVLPGNTMGFALNSGRIAGENAGNYVK